MAQVQAQSGDRWVSLPIQCKGGLTHNFDILTQGTVAPGSARVLQNFEVALEGGYRRIDGYSKFDTATVPGDANSAILGVKAAFGGVLAARRVSATPTTDIYFSTGSGWGSRINSANRGGNPTRVRMHSYAITVPTVAGVDGVNPAWKWDGTTYTLINGTGAPSDPSFVETFLNRLVLSGYSSNRSGITLSVPYEDTNYSAAAGAIEVFVGEEVTGLKNFRNQLYIFTKKGIYKLVGSTSADFVVQPVTSEIGCVAGDTIQEVGGDLIYLAPDGFRSVAGTYNIGDVDLSLQSRAIQPIVRERILGDTGITQYTSFPIRKKGQYRCLVYNPTTIKSATLGVIGKIEQAGDGAMPTYSWSTTMGIQAYCGDSYFDSNVERTVIGDPSNGYVYLLESGTTFDGTAIEAVFQSPYITFSDATLRKVMQKIDVYTQAEGNSIITLGTMFDFAQTGILQPPSQNLTIDGSFPVYGGGVYDTDIYASILFPVFKRNLIGSGFTTSFLFSSLGGAAYRIDSFQVTFAVKGRR